MRNIFRALAFLTLLLPGVAVAQCSAPLPANTVMGRLGINPGPCQAIPFLTLQSQLSSIKSGPATIKGNPNAVSSSLQDFSIQTLTNLPSPSATLDFTICYDHLTGLLKSCTPGAIATSGTAGVGSFNTLTGAVTTNVVVQKFTATSTYTPTAGMLHAIIECIGSGGGGGGITGNATGIMFAGGGGSGGYSMKRVTAADIGASQAVTIAAAGAGGAAGNNPGAAGGDVSLGSLCIAKGGSGGGFANSSTIAAGGNGGVAGTGDVAAQGNYGFGGFFSSVTNNVLPSGNGGSSALGGGAGNPVCTSGAAVNGTAAGPFGGGGGGACATASGSTAAGGNASLGIVIVTEFINM